jgi:hypothetical protein
MPEDDPAVSRQGWTLFSAEDVLRGGLLGERLGEIPEVLPRCRVDLLGVELERTGEESSFSHKARARAGWSIITSAVTKQNEHIVNVPSSPLKRSSVS